MTNKALFWSFYVSFCTFCASFRLKRTVFSWLLKKAISMALCTKAILCGKSSLLEQCLPRTPSWQKRSLPTFQVGPCNLWLIKDLRENKALYNCRETFTDVMSALQIRLFMQNEPNFRKSQMNVTDLLTRDYRRMDTWSIRKNKPNSNPIQSQSNPIKANKMPKQTQFKPKQTQFHMILAYFSSRAKKCCRV
ncbi:MAG: hypothetical protein ACYS91_03825 [Planctomycetota bacterium]